MGRGTWAWVSAAALGAIAVGCGGIGPQPPAGPAPLLLSQIAPTSGPVTGGTTVTLTGLYFQGGAAIAIGGSAAGSVVVVSTASITAVTTPGVSGPASVVVTNPDGGSATLYGAFTYLATPAVTAISPSTGDVSGGTPVTITGTGFSSGATVLLGSSLATAVNVVSATTVKSVTGSAVLARFPLPFAPAKAR